MRDAVPERKISQHAPLISECRIDGTGRLEARHCEVVSEEVGTAAEARQYVIPVCIDGQRIGLRLGIGKEVGLDSAPVSRSLIERVVERARVDHVARQGK